MVPSGLAMMDSSGSVEANKDVRTSTQTFMERNGSPQIRALEERAVTRHAVSNRPLLSSGSFSPARHHAHHHAQHHARCSRVRSTT